MPRVSVIVPVYNRESLLRDTLDSVRAQTLADWECIVVDDGSADGSFDVALRYAAEDPRFTALRREGEPKGASRCRNEGFAASAGDRVVFLDSDDILAPSCLEQRLRCVERSPGLDFLTWPALLFVERPGDTRRLWNSFSGTNDLVRFLGKDPVWHTSGPIWSRAGVARTGGWDEALPSWQDWDFHVRALVAGCRYVKIDVPDHYVRMAGNRIAVSAVSTIDRAHLASHVALFRRTARLVRAAGMMDEDARTRLASSFFWVARRWLSLGDTRAALGAWGTCFSCRLIGVVRAVEGLGYLALHDRRGGTRLLRRLERRWPAGLRVAGSPTLHRAEWERGGSGLAWPRDGM